MKRTIFLDLDNTIINSRAAYDFALTELAKKSGSFFFRGFDFLKEFEEKKKEVKELLKGHPGNKNRLLVFKKLYDVHAEKLDTEKLLYLEKNYFKYFKKNINMQLKQQRKSYKRLFTVMQKLSSDFNLFFLTNESLRTQLYKLSWIFPSSITFRLMCSEEVGVEKPSREFYNLALERSLSKPEDTIMIGDHLEDDVLGALTLNIKAYHLKEIFGEDQITENTLGNKKYFEATNLPFILEGIVAGSL